MVVHAHGCPAVANQAKMVTTGKDRYLCCLGSMVEQLICNQQVVGSSPTGSSNGSPIRSHR